MQRIMCRYLRVNSCIVIARLQKRISEATSHIVAVHEEHRWQKQDVEKCNLFTSQRVKHHFYVNFVHFYAIQYC